MMRSKLFVPGSRPEVFEKALCSDADAISFDLEDAVVEGKKEIARTLVKDFLDKQVERSKKIIVRTNHVSTAHFPKDVSGVMSLGLDILNIPKVEHADEVNYAAEQLDKYEREMGVNRSIPILVNIESPKGLRNIFSIANAHKRVVGLQIGYGDLFSPLDIDRTNKSAIENVMFTVRMASGEANIYAVDGAFTNVADESGYLEEATEARKFGFIGKSCIHPKQVALANKIFRPTDEAIAHALKVVQALETEEKQGVGAFTVDGKMVDAPLFKQAKKILESARNLNLIA